MESHLYVNPHFGESQITNNTTRRFKATCRHHDKYNYAADGYAADG
jgi:hypothetical protein